MIQQMPMFLQANLIDEKNGNAFIKDIEALNAANTFSAGFIVQAASGTKA